MKIQKVNKMTKWHKEIKLDDAPIYMYKLNKKVYEKFNKDECKKGILVEGTKLTFEWQSFKDRKPKLDKFLYNQESKQGFVDFKEFKVAENKVIRENIYK